MAWNLLPELGRDGASRTHDSLGRDLAPVVHAKNMWAQAELSDERNYYQAKTTGHRSPCRGVGAASLVGGTRRLGHLEKEPVEANRLHAD
jgi:hypothetical protein